MQSTKKVLFIVLICLIVTEVFVGAAPSGGKSIKEKKFKEEDIEKKEFVRKEKVKEDVLDLNLLEGINILSNLKKKKE